MDGWIRVRDRGTDERQVHVPVTGVRYTFRLTASILLYAPSYRRNNTYHGLCYTSRGALAGTRNSSMGPL